MVTAYRIAETKDQRTDDFNAVTSRAWRDEVVWEVSRCRQREHGKVVGVAKFAIFLRLAQKLAENQEFRQAHNLKVVGLNPTPATNKYFIMSAI